MSWHFVTTVRWICRACSNQNYRWKTYRVLHSAPIRREHTSLTHRQWAVYPLTVTHLAALGLVRTFCDSKEPSREHLKRLRAPRMGIYCIVVYSYNVLGTAGSGDVSSLSLSSVLGSKHVHLLCHVIMATGGVATCRVLRTQESECCSPMDCWGMD